MLVETAAWDAVYTLTQRTRHVVLSRRPIHGYNFALLVNLPTSTTAPLQRVQNDAARLTRLGSPSTHYAGAKTTTLAARFFIESNVKSQISWPFRRFKIATLMHQVYHRHWPQHLVNLVSFMPDTARQCLCSTAKTAAVSVRSRTNLGRRAFSVAGPSLWNSLLSSLRLTDSHKQFRRQLKTNYSNIIFS